MNPALKALIPSKATVAKMLPKPAELDHSLASIRAHDAKAKPRPKYGGYIPRPSHPVRIAAEGLGRFTVRDLAKLTGYSEANVLITLTCMRHAGLARIVTPSAYPVAVYERLDGGSLEGRAKTPGMAWIEAKPVGATFGFADIPGTRFQRAAAVERARKVGMVRRISARRTFAVWEGNKMSDTPRTDAKSVRFSTLCAERDQWWVPRETSRQLERELATVTANALALSQANAELRSRIRRLEEAADDLENSVACGCGIDGPCARCREALDGWKQAKETQP